jgi:hypothetical protein
MPLAMRKRRLAIIKLPPKLYMQRSKRQANAANPAKTVHMPKEEKASASVR